MIETTIQVSFSLSILLSGWILLIVINFIIIVISGDCLPGRSYLVIAYQEYSYLVIACQE